MAGAGFHSRFSLCRVLVQMCKTKAFRELCTPSPDLPQMVSTALKVLGVSPTPTPAGGTLWVSLFFHPMPTPQQIHMDHHGMGNTCPFNLVAPACGSHQGCPLTQGTGRVKGVTELLCSSCFPAIPPGLLSCSQAPRSGSTCRSSTSSPW